MIVLGADYEHTVSVRYAGAEGEISYSAKPVQEFYGLVLNKGPFEASEFSLANHIMYRDRGDDWLVAVPVFPSRVFRQSHLLVRKDSDLHSFSQLKGRTMGLPDYSMTAAVWLRGHIQDEGNVSWRDMNWVSGLAQRFPAPEGVKLEKTATPIDQLLLEGKIDVAMVPGAEAGVPPEQRRLRPLLDDPEGSERAYFERTGIFPIMHTVVIRREVLDANPQAARAIFNAYVAGKQAALKRKLGTTMMPWADRLWSRDLDIFGGDTHPYGLTPANRKTTETLIRYLADQKLIAKTLDVDGLFAPGSHGWVG